MKTPKSNARKVKLDLYDSLKLIIKRVDDGYLVAIVDFPELGNVVTSKTLKGAINKFFN